MRSKETRALYFAGVVSLFVGFGSQGVRDKMPVVRAADQDLREGPEVEGLDEEYVLRGRALALLLCVCI